MTGTTSSNTTPRRRRMARPADSAAVPPPTAKAPSKLDRVEALLLAETGASIAEIMAATGWQQHSVRGFFAAVVRKKLKLNLTSEPGEAGRIYRITDGNLPKGGIPRKTKSRAAR